MVETSQSFKVFCGRDYLPCWKLHVQVSPAMYPSCDSMLWWYGLVVHFCKPPYESLLGKDKHRLHMVQLNHSKIFKSLLFAKCTSVLQVTLHTWSWNKVLYDAEGHTYGHCTKAIDRLLDHWHFPFIVWPTRMAKAEWRCGNSLSILSSPNRCIEIAVFVAFRSFTFFVVVFLTS